MGATLSATSGAVSLSAQVAIGVAQISSGAAALPAPASFGSLAGCTNPNTGSSNDDWGVGGAPVYVDPVSLNVGKPVYSSNTIFWVSRETQPGQSVLMTGAFTDSQKEIRLASIPDGTEDWQSLVRSSKTVIPATQQSSTGLSFIVPASFATGVYGFEIDDPSAPPVFGMANQPSMSWEIAVPDSSNPSVALQQQVHDCGGEPGEVLRIFGKNFLPSSKVVLQSADGAAYPLNAAKVDADSIAAVIPSAASPGKYNLWVGDAPWSVTSSPASQITIYAPVAVSSTYSDCPSMVGDGSTDNTAILQSCLDRNAPAPGSNQLVYLTVPAGVFVLTGGIAPHPYEFIVGASASATSFIGKPLGTTPTEWITVPQYFGMANLSFTAPANPYLVVSANSKLGSPTDTGHAFFANVRFQSTLDATSGQEQMFVLAGPDIQVYNSVFSSGSNEDFGLNFGDGAIVSGNEFILDNWTDLSISDSQNVIFENNVTHSKIGPGHGANGMSGGSGLSISRANAQYGPSMVSRDIYVGYNTFRDMGSAGQQIITNDGDGGAYFGPIASSNANSVVLAYDPAWNWMGTTNPEASSIAIVSGTGVGQYSFLLGYSGRTVNLETPWKVAPDSTSVVVITQYELNMTVAHNTITNTLGSSIVLGDTLEAVMEDNVITNSDRGLLVSAYGPYGGPAAYGPVINTDVLRNTIAVGNGDLIASSIPNGAAGLGIQDMPGCLLSGMSIRDNVVPARENIYSTNGQNGISSVLVEQNEAIWLPTFPNPGFLVQENSAPPE
ncbi:MAG TPA: hypothetical protein VGR96_04120 [Acidobacteriaceae bacterium]|nr:hypothetical protein [Acidobacteriaceae bacterium]